MSLCIVSMLLSRGLRGMVSRRLEWPRVRNRECVG